MHVVGIAVYAKTNTVQHCTSKHKSRILHTDEQLSSSLIVFQLTNLYLKRLFNLLYQLIQNEYQHGLYMTSRTNTLRYMPVIYANCVGYLTPWHNGLWLVFCGLCPLPLLVTRCYFTICILLARLWTQFLDFLDCQMIPKNDRSQYWCL
jgi:hypothetical protein